MPESLSNLKKHGVSFEEAATVFSDPEALDWDDPEHSEFEWRSKRLGLSLTGKILIVASAAEDKKWQRNNSHH